MTLALKNFPDETKNSSFEPPTLRIVRVEKSHIRRYGLGISLAVSGMIVVVTAIQLFLSVSVAEGSYTLDKLAILNKDLDRTQQVLSENLEKIRSPQHLAFQAQQFGMVENSSQRYIRLSDGVVLGNEINEANPPAGQKQSLVIANSLLSDSQPTPLPNTKPQPNTQTQPNTQPHPNTQPQPNAAPSQLQAKIEPSSGVTRLVPSTSNVPNPYPASETVKPSTALKATTMSTPITR